MTTPSPSSNAIPPPTPAPPGGTLDLHEGMGQLALDKAGLLAEFQALSRPEGQAMRILDTDGAVLRDWQPRPDDRANPEIDRRQLRDLLLGPLDVQWGRGVTHVVPGTRDGVLVHFADGRQETFDLVIGADGAWSRIRPAVSSVTPHYTGVTSVETSLDDVDTRHPDLAWLIGDGSMAVYGVNRALVAQRNSGGHVKVHAQFRAPLDWHTDLDLADVEAVRSSLLALFDGWAAPVLDLLRHGTAFIHRPLYVLPVSHTWTHVPGVTLLGDAAHLMPPLGGGREPRDAGRRRTRRVTRHRPWRPGRDRPRLRGTDVGTGQQVGEDHDGRSGTPREPGPRRSPRRLRPSPAILSTSTIRSPRLHGTVRHRRGPFRQDHR
ncbi:hypothetical protein GCM10020295_38620 [Streptomyces cinereospinus]